MVKEIKSGFFVGEASKSFIQTSRAKVEPDAQQDFQSNDWSRWGDTNDYPQSVVDENSADATSAGAISFKRLAHFGAGIVFQYTEKGGKAPVILEIEDLPAEVQDFLFRIDHENLAQKFITDYEWWNFYNAGYMLNGTGNKIHSVHHHPTIKCRYGKKKNGQIPKVYLSGYWPNPVSDQIEEIPVLDRTQPFKRKYSIGIHKLHSVDKEYYVSPEWHSVMRWLSIARKIPEWINSNIDHSLNIKYHIEVPEAYFNSICPKSAYDSTEEWMKAKAQAEKDLYEKIDEVLAGSLNVSKTFYTKFAIDEDGKPLPGWKINVIENKIHDEAWLKAYGTGAAAICTGHGVPPSLAGLILSTGLGTGSASDTREQFNYYLQLRTVIPRQTTTEWWEWVKRFNGWNQLFKNDPNIGRDVKMWYRDIRLEAADVNKNGVNVQLNQPAAE